MDRALIQRPSGLWAHNHLESEGRLNKSKISPRRCALSSKEQYPEWSRRRAGLRYGSHASSRSPRILALISLSLRKHGQHFPVCRPSGHHDTHPLARRLQTTPHHTQPPPRAMKPEGKPRGPDSRVVSS